MNSKISLLIITLYIMAPVNAWAVTKGDPKAGASKAEPCVACHGADGNSANPEWPKLAGIGGPYIEKQLAHFRDGSRKNAMMNPMAVALSDQDIADLAAHFSAQKRSPGSADPKEVTVGERLYRGGNKETGSAACMACHGPSGAGNPAAKYPALGGQHAAYLATQLKAFRAGERSNDNGSIMRNIAGKLSDSEIQAVASYLSGLHD
jgi:cytochrome c553